MHLISKDIKRLHDRLVAYDYDDSDFTGLHRQGRMIGTHTLTSSSKICFGLSARGESVDLLMDEYDADEAHVGI